MTDRNMAEASVSGDASTPTTAPRKSLQLAGSALLLAGVPACFALNPVIARALVGVYEPATLTFIRWLLCAALIGAIALMRGRQERWSAAPRDLAALLFIGAIGMGFCSYAAYAGVKTATATTVGLIYACTAAVVTTYEMLRGTTRPSVPLVLGLLLSIAGVAVIIARGDPDLLLGLRIGPGELWAVAGMLMWAGYTVAMKRSAAAMTPLALFTVLAAIGAAACLPVALLEIAAHGMPRLGPVELRWLAALVLITGVGAFLGYNAAIRRNGAVLTAASICLAPLYIAGMALVLIGEQLAWYHAIAIVLVIAGLGMITVAKSRG